MATVKELDQLYFDDAKSWASRRTDWETSAGAQRFWHANAKDLAGRLSSAARGARAVINIGESALLKLLRGDRYKNAYILAEEAQTRNYALIGGVPPKPVEAERKLVDEAFDLQPAIDYFFAAVSMEGMGVRYYGDYCMALRGAPSDDTQIVDRDSYEILFDPLQGTARAFVVAAIRGVWSRDLHDMATLKIRRALERSERVTSGVIQARALLAGEEFIEVHLWFPATADLPRGFDRGAVEEVRQDSRDVAASERIDSLFAAGNRPRIEDVIFSLRRRAIERELSQTGIRSRVVREERVS